MSMLTIPTVLLTVRGTVIPPDRDATRRLHNQTAGSAEGVAAAQALGDLSHKAYTPVPGVPGAGEDELLFIDVWRDVEGLGAFFSDAQVQQGGSMLFSSREASVWSPAPGAFGFELEAPMSRPARYVGIVRGPIGDAAVAIQSFASAIGGRLADARRRGQLSHQLYVTAPGTGDGLVEVLGVDVWCNAEGMAEHYETLTSFGQAFTGPPATSVWEAATGGEWTEW